MSGSVDLNPNYLETVMRILAEHVPECEARVFGSRATWTAKDYSDLDLAIVGEGPLDRRTLGRLEEAFEESSLPMRVDVLDWHAISESFREVIERDCVVVQEGAEQSTAREWREVTLGEFAPLTYGKGLTTNDRSPSGDVPVIGSNGIIGYHDSPLTDGPTIVIGRKGTVGAVYYSPVPCWPIDTTFFITSDDAELLKFQYFALKTLPLQEMNSDSAVPGLNRNEAHACMLRVPDEGEQRAIAHILGTLDDKIELNRRMNQTLESMARAIFQDWFVDFGPTLAKMEGRAPYLPPEVWSLFPDRLVDSELGPIPEGWGVRTLGEVAKLSPESWSKLNYPENVEYVDLAHTKRGVIESTQRFPWKDAPSRAKRVLRSGDTIVGTVRPGNCSYSLVGADGLTGSTGFAVLRPLHPRSRELIYLTASAPENIERLAHRADGAAYPAVRPEVVGETEIAIPASGTEVLDRFSNDVAPILDKIESTKMESRTLAALRDALLLGLVSGEVGVGGSGNTSSNCITPN